MIKADKRSFASILFVIAIDNFGFCLIFVMFAPLIFSTSSHLLPADTSLAMRNVYLAVLFAAYPLTQLFGAPILGDIADQTGRKKALYISIAGVVLGFLLSGLSIVLWSFSLLIISRLLAGFFSGNLSICLSAIADMSPTEKERSKNFGIVTVVWAVTGNLAAISGGYLSDPTQSRFFTPSLPFWLTAVLTLLSFFAIAKYYLETHQPDQKASLDLMKGLRNITASLKIEAVRPYFIVLIFWTLSWGLSIQSYGTYSILKYHSSQQMLAWALLIQGVCWSLGGSIMNPLLLKKLPSLSIAIIGHFFCALFLLATALGHTYFLFNLFYWIAAIFASFGFSNTMNLASIHAPEVVQGKIMGLSQSMMSLGFVIVPVIGGIAGTRDIELFYPLCAIFMGVAFLLLLLWGRKAKIG